MVTALILILSFGLMAAGVVLSRQSDHRGTPIAAVGVVVALLTMAINYLGVFESKEDNTTLMAAQTDNASKRLGRYLAENFPDARVVIIKPYDHVKNTELRDAMVAGLTSEIQEKMKVVKVVDPPLPDHVRAEYEKRQSAERAEAEIPDLDQWFNAEHFDRVLETHAIDCDLVVSLAGLPEDSPRMRFWRRDGRPKLALGFNMTRLPLRRFVDGDVVASVSYRHKTPTEAELPVTDDDVIATFNKRYYLITPGNAAEIHAKQPRLFRKRRPRTQP